ncbi:lasso peptide isopeptide bond-forming cyclase [aff. Roholtiella sp. LEGE 12411]|uniref:lasso peptide isopeptide bond-forming cyclase n=1 Tax=aff. Roholtiella sp. LEGE 12411 TaxID=1828822 RepID=UPI001880030F|nr:lasso peptide isopeptide bond-forming cyclase [aff. Roholtiella sp. LEGE 12411]MBE9038102.1 lasso peptide isopeptide bond-forming cyclase [aff. Roholtiella sp. LEGE 12411]
MSGIVGIYYLDGRPVERENLGRMVDILAHRGPDGADIWCEESVGLGHRMLWTTPESLLEKLPLVNQTGNLVITADARIDNRDELISALSLTDRPVEKITDSQLILAAYEKWGEQCPEKLIGDFAFAIWDGRQQKLFCARDHMGVKPFYYYCSNRVFILASEIKALLSLSEVPRRLNELQVAYHLDMFFEDQEITFYQEIFRLPAARYLTISSTQKMQVQSYWALDRKRELRLNSDEEYAEAFREIFTEAVRCRLRSAFPIGSTLSGGLDSSSIACTARQLLAKSGNQQLHTFSAIFPSLPEEDLPWIDERPYMDAVKALGGFQAHDVRADLLTPLIEILWREEEPILAPNLYIHQGMYECAHQHSVRVFLDGVDGDSTVSHGWRYLTELAYTGRWVTLMKEVTATGRRFRVPRSQLLWANCVSPLLIEPANQFWQALRKYVGKTSANSELINPAFAKGIKLVQQTRKLLSHEPALTLTGRQQHWQSLTTGLYPYILEMADKTTARYSLEGRYPFFDRRLMEFCLSLPSNQKFSHGFSRAILRNAMTDILPPKIQQRVSKANLGFNFKRRLLEDERETLEKVINQPKSIEPYVNLPVLRASYDHYSHFPQSEEESLNVLSGVTLALWLSQPNFTT